ncbi:MAG: heavy metal translocating P-type ATPase [Herbinix sp.]|nr:heavy metal translocating P-type ATPase [Herbinix sp.]
MDNKKEYILEGLNCANCAAKIEKEVGDLSEVNDASLNLMNCKLSISLNGTADITKQVKQIVAYHEPSVKVKYLSDKDKMASNEHGHEHKHKHGEMDTEIKLYFFRLMAAVALTVVFTLISVPDNIKLGAFIIAYFMVGFEVLSNAGKNILKGKLFDENFLMGIASLGAFLIGERVEAIAVLVFYGIGELLQDMAVSRSRKNIAGLMDIRPDYANKLSEGNVTVVIPEQIEIGDRILVKPGEKIPLDGIIVKGASYIDTRALTGESVPREVSLDDMVLSGAINTSGVLELEVTKTYGESTVSKILELVQNAGSKKAESEKFITKFARFYTPIVVFLAVAVAVFPPLLGFGSFTDWLYRALSFLIISCPCALVISIPLSFFGGIGGGANQGILIKGGNYLDALKQVDTIVFDKTGTLTKGVFEVSKICPVEGVESFELIKLAAIAESQSTHPIAKSILSYIEKNSAAIDSRAEQITEAAGRGVIAEYGKDTIYAGNEKLMREYNIQINHPQVSGSIIYVALNKKYMGYILIADEIKPGVTQAMTMLKQLGIKKTIMLTGDHKNAAKEIAELCRVDDYEAELLPQDKVEWFEKYKKNITGKGKIVFVGDGINDAPVLAGADIGIAMGGIGSDAAIEAADVVIMNDDISKIATAIKIAHKTKQIVYQNIIFALGIKILIMVLAFFGITSIWFAIFADVGVALLAMLNAMRAMRVR